MAVTNSIPLAQSLGSATTHSLRDIKPPVEIPNGWAWLWWLLGAAAVAALAWVVWRYWLKRLVQRPAPPPTPPHVRAKWKLQEALALIHQPEPFIVAVSGAIRVYLEERFTFHAPERTTEEFLHELRDIAILSSRQKESLGGFLTSCDLVKFAKYEPGEPELREMHGAAVRLVDETQPVVDSQPPAAAPPALDATRNTQNAATSEHEDEGRGRARKEAAAP